MLYDVSAAVRMQDTLRRKSGRGFNIFTVMHTEHDEVRIARVLCELLDPNGSHAQGAIFLRQFAQCVLLPHMKNVSFTDEEYARAVVEREYSIVGGRRIDLFLQIGACSIPIEVKIYAGDQEDQCLDYHRYAVNSPLFYLTLEGKEADEYSAGTLTKKEVRPISFKTDILRWLEACLCQPTIVPLAPIREVLLQLIDVIKKLTEQVEDSMQAEIEKIICENSDTLFGAMQINKAAQHLQKKIVSTIFEELDKRITEKYRLSRIINENDYMNSKKWRGIGYPIDQPTNNYALALRVELYDDLGKIGVGICAYADKQIVNLGKDMVSKLNDIVSGDSWVRENSGYWPIWQVVGKKDAPDFKEFNQAWCDLIEPDQREAFIDDCMVLVDAIADGLRPPYKIEKR